MAVVIPKEWLDPNKLQFLQEILVIKPKVVKRSNMPPWLWQKLKEEEGEDNTQSITFYRTIDRNIILPYTFGQTLVQKCIGLKQSKPSMPIKFTGTLLDYQTGICEEAHRSLVKSGCVILKLYTSFGKTLVSAYQHTLLGGIALILVTSTILLDQWAETYRTFTDGGIWIVPTAADLSKGGGKYQFPDNLRAIICMDTRIDLLTPQIRSAISVLIIDECHKFCTPSQVNVLLAEHLTPKYVIACSATYYRPDGCESMIQAICGNTILEKISEKPFQVICYQTQIPVLLSQNKYGNGLDWPAYLTAVHENRYRNYLLLDWVRRNLYQLDPATLKPVRKHKFLILTWQKKHGLRLVDLLRRLQIKVDYMIGTKKEYADSDVLVGTFAKIGTGFDEKTACADFDGYRIDVLLIAGSMREVSLLEQVSGRVFRAQFPNIVYFLDNSPIAQSHWKIAQKWFKSRKGTIVEVNGQFNSNDLFNHWSLVEQHLVNLISPFNLSLEMLGESSLQQTMMDPDQLEQMKNKGKKPEISVDQVNLMIDQLSLNI